MSRRVAFAGVAVAIVVGLAAAAWFAPALALAAAQSAASRALGWPVRIGALHLLPTWPPALIADRVSVDGVGTVAQVRATLDAGALWDRRNPVDAVRLIGPDLVVQTDASGLVSPRLAPRSPASGTGAAHGAPSAGPARPRTPPDVAVENARIAWRDPRFGGAITLRGGGHVAGDAVDGAFRADLPPGLAALGLSDLRLGLRATPGQPAQAALSGQFRAEPFTADLAGPPLDQLRPRQPAPVDLSIHAAGGVLTARGRLNDMADPTAFSGHAALRADDAAAMARRLGLPPLPAGPLAAEAEVQLDRATLAWRGLSLRSALADLTGEGALRIAAKPDLRARLDVTRLDADAIPSFRVTRPAPGGPAPPGPAPAGARPPGPPAPPSEARLIPDTELPWKLLNDATGMLRLRVAHLVWRGADYTDLAADVALSGAVLDAETVAVTLPGGGTARGSARLDDWADPPAARLTLHAPAVPLPALLGMLGQPPVVDGQAAVGVDLRGTGANWRALAASLDGTASLHMGAGSVRNSLLNLILSASGLPTPRLRGATRVRCVDLEMKALAGTIDFSSLVVDTDRLRIDGDGVLDLGDESLNFSLHPLWRGGFGFSVPMDVRGTLARPSLGAGGMLATLMPPPSTACPDEPAGSAPPLSDTRPKLPRLKDLLRQLR